MRGPHASPDAPSLPPSPLGLFHVRMLRASGIIILEARRNAKKQEETPAKFNQAPAPHNMRRTTRLGSSLESTGQWRLFYLSTCVLHRRGRDPPARFHQGEDMEIIKLPQFYTLTNSHIGCLANTSSSHCTTTSSNTQSARRKWEKP
jgi:hypothetical protein